MADEFERVFFYGSFINLKVLAEVDFRPRDVETARLDGWSIRIAPLANLVPAPDEAVHGIVCRATRGELDRLYGQNWVEGLYRPRPVEVETVTRGRIEALCYVASRMEAAPADADYVDRIVQPAKRYRFPARYIERLESFKPPPEGSR